MERETIALIKILELDNRLKARAVSAYNMIGIDGTRDIIEDIYGVVVSSARSPDFYRELVVEVGSLHRIEWDKIAIYLDEETEI